MEVSSLSGGKIGTKIYSGILLTVATVITALAAYSTLEFHLREWLILLFAVAGVAFIGQHSLRIPRTTSTFSGRELMIFWAAVWLGMPGAVFLGVACAAARYPLFRENQKDWLFGIASNCVAAYGAAFAAFLMINQTSEVRIGASIETVGLPLVVAAIGVMSGVHFLLSGFLNGLYLVLEDQESFREIAKAAFARRIPGVLLTIPVAVLAHVLFIEFGTAFGFVVFPMTVIAHLAHRFHIQRLEQKTSEIGEASRVHLATVEALATAIDARDQVGVGHVRRTQIYSLGMGHILGLSQSELDALNAGALLHDIGKLAVPDHILNKPGRLTPAEMEKAKIHAAVGASILEKVQFSYPVVPTVKYHHECWDGTGYPEGLKGLEIPLTARILAVADAYDTLRGARPYRAAVTRDDARRFLINGAGTQFDPKIVDVFLRNLKKFEAAVDHERLSYTTDAISTEMTLSGQSRDSKSYVEQIKRANREVFTLYELARIFSSSLNLEETFSLFAEKIGGLVPFDTCVVYLLDETGNSAKAVYTEGRNADALLHREVQAGEGATGYVLKKRQPVCNVNPALDFSFSQLEFVLEYSAMAALPLIADEKLLGAVSIYSCALEHYEDEHLRLLETVSRIAADAISKSIYHAETETRALTDPMTGLPNARSLQIHFEKEVARADRNNSSFQVLMLDLDGFKAVNDTFGHKAGDKLLRELSKVMRAQLRDYDFLSRYAGDEFVAIIPETEEISVEELAGRLEKAVTDFVLPIGDGRFARVGISIGAASYPHGGDTIDQIIISADKAMYNVKSLRKKLRAQETEKLEEQKRQLLSKNQPQPIQVRVIEPKKEIEPPAESNSESFVVELDESHIVSSAIN